MGWDIFTTPRLNKKCHRKATETMDGWIMTGPRLATYIVAHPHSTWMMKSQVLGFPEISQPHTHSVHDCNRDGNFREWKSQLHIIKSRISRHFIPAIYLRFVIQVKPVFIFKRNMEAKNRTGLGICLLEHVWNHRYTILIFSNIYWYQTVFGSQIKRRHRGIQNSYIYNYT